MLGTRIYADLTDFRGFVPCKLTAVGYKFYLCKLRVVEHGFNGFSRIRRIGSCFCCASFPLCLCVKKSFKLKKNTFYTLPKFFICQKDFHTEAQRHRGSEAQQAILRGIIGFSRISQRANPHNP
ncbi:MAG: hypothetical protein FWG87_04490 [Defluviitaleaceae bacterium]|nr:hypothetical protein [Defluviitaleaceae bacterium]